MAGAGRRASGADGASGSSSSSTTPRPTGNDHRPPNPSTLRQSFMPSASTSPEDRHSRARVEEGTSTSQEHAEHAVSGEQRGRLEEADDAPNVATALLGRHHEHENYGSGTTGRSRRGRGYGSIGSVETFDSFERSRPSLGGRFTTLDDINRQPSEGILDHLPDAITDGLLGRPKKRGTTHWLATRAGIKKERLMCVHHYFPLTHVLILQ